MGASGVLPEPHIYDAPAHEVLNIARPVIVVGVGKSIRIRREPKEHVVGLCEAVQAVVFIQASYSVHHSLFLQNANDLLLPNRCNNSYCRYIKPQTEAVHNNGYGFFLLSFYTSFRFGRFQNPIRNG